MCAFQSTLTWVGLEQNFCLPQDLLSPVLGAVGPREQVLQVRVQLGLLSLSQFLLCELKTKPQKKLKKMNKLHITHGEMLMQHYEDISSGKMKLMIIP